MSTRGQQCAADSSAGSLLTRRTALGYLAGGVGLFSELKSGVAEAQTVGSSRFGPPPAKNGIISIGGVNIYYEEQGQGIPIVLSPPGLSGAETTRPGAAKLATKYRVISWDRPNTPGRSDIEIKGPTDVDLWADQLYELLARLNARPAYFAGGSMGLRTNFAFALRYPDIVRGLFIYSPSSNYLWNDLPVRYWANHADVADKAGMQAVAATPYWAEVIAKNPRNRERLLKTDPREFSRVMRRWTNAYKESDVTLKMTEGDARRHDASGIPTRILAGCDFDKAHPREATELVRKVMPHAEYIEAPTFCGEFEQANENARAYAIKHKQDDRGNPVTTDRPYVVPYFEMPSLLASIDDFVMKTEAKMKVGGR